jgi:hypothetical protein
MNNMPVRKRYIVWQHGLHKPGSIMLQPNHMVTFAC